ncbi:MAG: acetolactate synthase small subunit [Oscillospiraceae bacterium]|jgi:acetolactate synthase-1/3 small subunit|nr:acetolactate synthase small subunit [Oscillospiraceae bacterium]
MEQREKFTVGVMVNNHFGVLNRVAGLFAKRGYNIDSLAVGETENRSYSRITIVCTGSDYMREQVVRQLEKLQDVIQVILFDDEATVSVEHLLIKLSATGEKKASLTELVNRYGGKVMDFGADFITAEITAASERIDKFIEAARPVGILETCRSGALAMSHGTERALRAPV